MLLAGRQGQRQRVAEIGGDDVEGDRLRTPAEMRVPAVQDHALRHGLVFRDQLLDVDHVHHRAEGNGDPGRPPFQLARTPEARGGTAAHPQPVIALQVADRHALTDGRRILGAQRRRRLDPLGDLAEDLQRLFPHRHVQVVHGLLRVPGNTEGLEDAVNVFGKRHSRSVKGEE